MTTHTLTMPDAEICTIPERKAEKAEKKAAKAGSGAPASAAGTIWFIGWLFTIGYADLVWWKALLGVIVWPYFLGVAVH